MTCSTKAAGNRGEELAAQFLQARGFTILDRNWRQRWGELDLVAARDGLLVFCEVKASRFEGDCHPELRVDFPKQRTLTRLARAWLAGHDGDWTQSRFDVIAVKIVQGREVVEHLENAFWPVEE
ncbi:MAG: YraN family protein [Candidatus Zixiibacteriota bacterium]|nr:MAG: YraN family protein [candidate division Zixibacteria bacterium]